jgi:hypothetical protein
VKYPDSTWVKQLIPIVVWGRVEYVHCSNAAATDNTLLAIGTTAANGICVNFSHAEFTSKRRLGGVGTVGVGAFSLQGDSAPCDWTNSENAPFFDTTATTGMVGAASVNVPTVSMGIVGICKRAAGDTTAIPDHAPFLSATPIRREAIVMCMANTAGKV